MLDSPFDMTCVLLNCETYNRNLFEIKFVNDLRSEVQSVSKLGSGVYTTFIKSDTYSEKKAISYKYQNLTDLGYETNIYLFFFYLNYKDISIYS